MEDYKEIERSITKSYRKKIWAKFIKGISEFQMVQDGDKIAICISGGKDSMLMAKCFQILKKYSETKFELEFIVMNPGYSQINKQKIIENAKILNIPITMFESSIFDSVEQIEDNPCYICARMRRGYLYEEAKRLGCNKIALGHHFNDVIETILMGMLYGAQVQTMMPKLHSKSHPGMELIRPLYYVREEDIISWANYNKLEFINCACKITQRRLINQKGKMGSKREKVKELIKKLKQDYDKVDMNIFRSVENVNLSTIISYKDGDKIYHFMDGYDRVFNGDGDFDNKIM